MIKLLGVITSSGLPVKIESFIELESKELIASLIEATKAISKVLGRGSVREIDFGEDKLLITEAEKGYLIVTLVDVAEEYMNALLRFIARIIDECDIPASQDIVDSQLVDMVSRIISRYIKSTIDIDMLGIMENVWDPMLEIITGYEDAITHIDNARSEIHKHTRRYRNAWERIISKKRYSLKDALRFALSLQFDRAASMSIRNRDIWMKILAIKTGILSLSVSYMPFPSIEELESIAKELPDDAFSRLARICVEHIARGIDLSVFLEAFKGALSKFRWEKSPEDIVKAYLLWSGYISFFPEQAEKLSGYFEAISKPISNLIKMYIEEGSIYEKVYSVTSYSEIKELVIKWRSKIKSILDETNKALRFIGLKKKLGILSLDKRQRIMINTSKIRLYLDILTLLLDSPVVGPMERLDIAREIIGIGSKYLETIIKNRLSCFISDILGIMQNYALALSYIFFVEPNQKEKILDDIKHLYRLLWEFVSHEYSKIGSYYVSYLATIACFLSFPLAIMGDIYPEELKTVYAISSLFDPRTSERFAKGYPYTYATDIENLSSILTSLAKRILGKDMRKKILRRTTKILIDLYKWFIFQGKVSRDSTMQLFYYLSRIVEYLDEKELLEIADFVLMLAYITVPDWEKNDYELAILSESGIIDLLSALGMKLKDEKYLDVARRILEISIKAWEKYGFPEKARILREKYWKNNSTS